MKFGNLIEVCVWLNLAVKGLRTCWPESLCMAEEPRPLGQLCNKTCVYCMSSRFFENQPNENCSHLSEKASKGRFFGLYKLQNHSNEESKAPRSELMDELN